MRKELSIKLHLYPEVESWVADLTNDELMDLSHLIVEELSNIDLLEKIKGLKKTEIPFQIHECEIQDY